MVSKQDYYELLDIPNNASSDDIKSAYKRQALIWHPDKNHDRAEEATERFKQINEAYSVLSDPRERAWYDTHKDQILSGSGEDPGINLWPFFSPSAYPGGFTDEPDGFYTVYRGVFETITKEENSEAGDIDEIQQRPIFGDSTTPIEIVIEFYNHWTNFATNKKFFWADKYDTREGEHRRIRRLMEAENKKERSREKRAYVDQVRELAEYARRRDPRWLEHQKKLAEEKEAKMLVEKAQREEEARKLKELKEKYREEQAKRYAQEYEEMKQKESLEGAQEDSEEETNAYNCELCSKSFSTEKQLENHENSKKHKQKYNQLKQEVELREERPPPPPKPKKEKNPKPVEEAKAPPPRRKVSEVEEVEDDPDDIALNMYLRKRKETDDDDIPIPQKPKKPKNWDEEETKATVESQKIGKAKLKRQKKKEKEDGTEICKQCKQRFDTRNKLFTHLKTTGHARAGD